jgi:ERCC4-related helicase
LIKKRVKKLVSQFKENLSDISEFMEDIIDKFFEKLYSLTSYSKNDKIRRTTSQTETFNSLPQIRHHKHTSKKPWNLLLSIASTIKFYKPNYRTLKLRH